MATSCCHSTFRPVSGKLEPPRAKFYFAAAEITIAPLRSRLETLILSLKATNLIASGEIRRECRKRFSSLKGTNTPPIVLTASDTRFALFFGILPTLLNLSAARTFKGFQIAPLIRVPRFTAPYLREPK